MGELTKLVEDWWKAEWGKHQPPSTLLPTHRLLLAMAEQIEANEAEIEQLKESSENPYLLSEEEIEQMRQRM